MLFRFLLLDMVRNKTCSWIVGTQSKMEFGYSVQTVNQGITCVAKQICRGGKVCCSVFTSGGQVRAVVKAFACTVGFREIRWWKTKQVHSSTKKMGITKWGVPVYWRMVQNEMRYLKCLDTENSAKGSKCLAYSPGSCRELYFQFTALGR
jgi:hypothetical protein